MNMRFRGRLRAALVVALVGATAGLLPGPGSPLAGAMPARGASCPDNVAQRYGIQTTTGAGVATWVPERMQGVAALSPHDVWIGGDVQRRILPPATSPISPTLSLIEHWDGHRWCVAANTEHQGMSVTTLVAPDPTSVWAVVIAHEVGLHDLLERWDGHRWAVVPLPSAPPVTGFVSPALLAASSPRNVWLVRPQGQQEQFIGVQRWDGQAWQPAEGGLSDNTVHWFTALATRSAADTWAAMHDPRDPNEGRPVILHWDGVRWQQAGLPAPTLPFLVTSVTINAFALLGARDVWALGDYELQGGDQRNSGGPLAYHWDGRVWREVPVPNNPQVKGPTSTVPGWGLVSLAVLSPTKILAMGGGGTSHFTVWNGRRWSVLPTAAAPGSPADDHRWISGLSALNARDIWAVGGYNPYQPGPVSPDVAEHWDGRFWHAIPYIPAG